MKLSKRKLEFEKRAFEKWVLDLWYYAKDKNPVFYWRYFGQFPSFTCDVWKRKTGGVIENGEIDLQDYWKGWLARASFL